MKSNKILLTICVICMLFLNTLTIHAGYTFTVSSSKSQVNPNESFTVTVKVPGSGMFFATASNGNVSPSSKYCDTSCTFEATAGSSGTTKITITAGKEGTSNEVTAFEDDSAITGSKGVSVKIKSSSSSGSSGSSSTVTKSSDNSLKSLTVSEGTLSPAFSKDVTEYTLELGPEINKINVKGIANHEDASVKGNGDIDLTVGENIIKITVTAENGNPKVYKINAIVDDAPLVFVKFNDSELGVVRNLDSIPKLDGFEETTVKIDDKEINAWYSQERNITVLYLQDENTKDFYLYDETNGITSKFNLMNIDGKLLGFSDIPTELQEKNGFTYQEVTINDKTLMGWVFNNESFKNYSLIYAMDDEGNYNFYQYENTQKTLQLYSNAAPMTFDEYNEELKNKEEEINTYKQYFYIACGVAGFLFLCFLFALINANRYKKRLIVKTNRENKVD